MAHDPVCKMEVDETTARYKSEYQGKTYYFDTPGCKEEFDLNPGMFAAAESTAGYGTAMKEKAGQTYRKLRESRMYRKAQERGEQLKGKAKGRAKSMISTQKDRTLDTLGSVAQALHSTAQNLQDQRQDPLARYVHKAAEKIEQASGYLEGKDADQLITDAERFARRRPALFLGGAFAAGFALARFLKSSGSSRYAGTYEAGGHSS